MEYREEKYKNYDFITIKNDANLKVTLSSFGASIYSIYFDDKIMTLTHKNYDDFFAFGQNHGKIMGRITNRIKDGILTIGNEVYQLEKNELGNCLHSGHACFGFKKFDYHIEESNEDIKVIFHYFSIDLEGGFPGNLDINIIYTLYRENNKLLLEIKAKSDKDTKVNFTNHLFLCLNEEDINNMTLYIDAKEYVHPLDNLVPNKIELTPDFISFYKAKQIKNDLLKASTIAKNALGYDYHYIFCLDDIKDKVILSTDNYELRIQTNFSGIQIYTDNYGDDFAFISTNKKVYRGIALEPEDCNLSLDILKANEEYIRFIGYSFIKKEV